MTAASTAQLVDVLLIGGGVAAASVAAELRAGGFAGSVMLVTREREPPYRRPPLTKGLLVGRERREGLRVHADDWWSENDVELRTQAAVMALDTRARTVTLANKARLGFDRAVLATGAMVRRLRIDGAGLDGIHYLRAPGNVDALRQELRGVRRVVVVGGSFIAVEVAASLTTLGKRCALVMQEELPLERALGRLAGRYVGRLLADRGIELHACEDVVAFEGETRVAAVRTGAGLRLDADMVVVGAGAVPDTMLARRAGLEIGGTGGILCDSRLMTSAPGVYAAGDVCEYDSIAHGRRLRVEHEDHAAEQGRTVARNLLGRDAPHTAVPYFWSDLADWASLECVGPPERWDDQVLVGDPLQDSFAVWYVRDGIVVGALSVGGAADLDAARDLIARAAPVSRLGARR